MAFQSRYLLIREHSSNLLKVGPQSLLGIVVSWELNISLPESLGLQPLARLKLFTNVRGGVSLVQGALELHMLLKLCKTA